MQSLLDLIRKALEKIEEFLSAGDPNSSVQLAAEAEADTARNMIRLLSEALDSASDTVSQVADGDTVTITGNEGAVRNSYLVSKDSVDTSSIKEQMRNHLEKLNAMEAVAVVTAPTDLKHNRSDPETIEWVKNSFSKTGYVFERRDIGKIQWDHKLMMAGMKYLVTSEEVAAYVTLPRVVKRGLIVDGHLKHKGNDFDTITIAAPVVLNGKRGIVGVVLYKDSNKYRVHRIVTPEGSRFKFEKKKAESTPAIGASRNDAVAPIDSASNTKIAQKDPGVKNNSMQSAEKNSKVERRSIDIDSFAKDDKTIKELKLLAEKEECIRWRVCPCWSTAPHCSRYPPAHHPAKKQSPGLFFLTPSAPLGFKSLFHSTNEQKTGIHKGYRFLFGGERGI